MTGPNAPIGLLGDQRGLTMVELMVALIILAVGLTSAATGLLASKRTTTVAQRHEIVVHQAQLGLERIRALDYDNMLLPETPDPCLGVPTCAPPNDTIAARVYGSPRNVAVTASWGEVLAQDATCDNADPDASACLYPGSARFPTSFDAGGVTGKIFYYVSWRASCGDNTCGGTRDSKRLTVAAVLDPPTGGSRAEPKRPVWTSTVVAPPKSPPTGGTVSEAASQLFYLYDTPCDVGATVAADNWNGTTLPNHGAWDTAARSSNPGETSSCWNTHTTNVAGVNRFDRRPDLMGPALPPGATQTAPSSGQPFLPRYANGYNFGVSGLAYPYDAATYPGGLPMAVRSTNSCPTGYTTTGTGGSDTATSRHTIHRWVTGRFRRAFDLSGPVTLNLRTHTLGNYTNQDGAICVTLTRWREEAGVGAQDVGVPTPIKTVNCGPVTQWPQSAYSGMTTNFDPLRIPRPCDMFVSPTAVAAGDRLALTVSVPNTATKPLIMFYGDPDVPTSLRVTTTTPCGASGPCPPAS